MTAAVDPWARKRDAESAGKAFDEGKMNEAFDRDIMPFIKLYEEPLVRRADLVLRKVRFSSLLQRTKKADLERKQLVDVYLWPYLCWPIN